VVPAEEEMGEDEEEIHIINSKTWLPLHIHTHRCNYSQTYRFIFVK
jgi:hypothetical protein